MKKTFIFLLALLFIVGFSVSASATEAPGVPAPDISEILPNEVADAIPGGGSDPGGLLEFLTAENIWNLLTNGLSGTLRGTLSDFRGILLIVMVFLVVRGIGGFEGSTAKAFELVLTFALAISVYQVVNGSVDRMMASFSGIGDFMKSLLPIMAALMTGVGSAVSASVLPSFILFGLGIITSLLTELMAPLLSIFFALCLVDSVGSKGLGGLAKTVKSVTMWGAGFVTTILTAILSLQRVIGGASDSVAGKAAKYAVGSFVPVVGGIIKDTYETVAGGVLLIKSTAGVAGILVVVYIVAPVIILAASYCLMMKVCGALATVVGESSLSNLMEGMGDIFQMILAAAVCQGLFAIISLAILMSVRGAS